MYAQLLAEFRELMTRANDARRSRDAYLADGNTAAAAAADQVFRDAERRKQEIRSQFPPPPRPRVVTQNDSS